MAAITDIIINLKGQIGCLSTSAEDGKIYVIIITQGEGVNGGSSKGWSSSIAMNFTSIDHNRLAILLSYGMKETIKHERNKRYSTECRKDHKFLLCENPTLAQ